MIFLSDTPGMLSMASIAVPFLFAARRRMTRTEDHCVKHGVYDVCHIGLSRSGIFVRQCGRKRKSREDLETDVRRTEGVRFSSQRTARPPANMRAEMPARI